MKKIIGKLKVSWIFAFIVWTILIVLTIREMWASEPREFIKEDELLMAIHPFTLSMLSVMFVGFYLFTLHWWLVVLKIINKIQKSLNSESHDMGGRTSN